MGLFGIGGSKSKSSSKSSANTFVDPNQAPYLQDIRGRAQQLGQNGMPVEGVAAMNPYMNNALGNQYSGGNMQAGAGAALMGSGSNLARGSNSALRFSNQAMMGGPYGGVNAAFGAGNQFAGGVQGANAAQGVGVDYDMANRMGNSAATAGAASMGAARMGSASMGAASNSGFDINNVSKYINNDVLQGQIDAASRDITRNLQQSTLPGIQGQAAGSGNSGSSRVGNMMGTAMGMANESIGDISANMRGNALNQGFGIEARRASENAGYQQGANQANANFMQNANQANAGYQQGANQANANFMQNANQFNAGARNSLLSQGYGVGASQLESNLGRQQQGNQFNAGQFNQARQYGSGVGQNAFNTNQQSQQFGANLAARLGSQGVSNMTTGANMFNTGVGQQMAMGQYGRDYEQQLLNQQYRQQMAPYNSLNFYNQIVGAPNNLSNSTASSKGSSSSFNLSV